MAENTSIRRTELSNETKSAKSLADTAITARRTATELHSYSTITGPVRMMTAANDVSRRVTNAIRCDVK